MSKPQDDKVLQHERRMAAAADAVRQSEAKRRDALRRIEAANRKYTAYIKGPGVQW